MTILSVYSCGTFCVFYEAVRAIIGLILAKLFKPNLSLMSQLKTQAAQIVILLMS